MKIDLSLMDAPDRKHVCTADRCDSCGAPEGVPLARTAIKGAPAWAAPGVWFWTACDGRRLGVYVPGLSLLGGAGPRVDRVVPIQFQLAGGRCPLCARRRPAGQLLELPVQGGMGS